MRTIIIGDIHGCFKELVLLLEKVQFDQGRDLLISLGDMIDRGPRSFQVFEYLRSLKSRMGEACILIRGNHEQMMIDYGSGCDCALEMWEADGGSDTRKDFLAHHASIEEAARTLRYAFLFQQAEAKGCDKIATAHNADDNAETMLLSLIRGTGITGLTGIPFRRENIVRPLLSMTRCEILSYLEEHQIPHREDSSNRDETYARNKLRAKVMPVLRGLNFRAVEHMARTAAQLAEIDRYLDENARGFLSQVQESPGKVSLSLDALSQAPQVLRPRMIFQLLDRLGVGRKDFRTVHLDAILSLSPGGCLDLPHGVTARREYGVLIFTTRKDNPSTLEPFPPQQGKNPVPGTPWVLILDAPPWPGLVVRPRQTGDEITLPNGHSRSLKRLLIDQKIPRPERGRLPVAADGDGILAVAGLGHNLAHPRRERIKFIKETEEKEHAHE